MPTLQAQSSVRWMEEEIFIENQNFQALLLGEYRNFLSSISLDILLLWKTPAEQYFALSVGFLFLLAMLLGAFTCGKRFRFFSIGTTLILVTIGVVSALIAGVDISQHGFIRPPQWFGLIERIDIYVSML